MLIVDKMIQFVNSLKTYIILYIAKVLKLKLQIRARIGDGNKILKKKRELVITLWNIKFFSIPLQYSA